MKKLRMLFPLVILFIVGCGKNNPASPSGPLLPTNPNKKEVTVIHDDFGGMPIVLAGSPGLNFIVSYQREIDGVMLTFEPLNLLPVIMEDNEGTRWNIFGEGVSGPRTGEKLALTHSFMGYFFSFGSMYPGLEIHDGESLSAEDNPAGSQGWLIPRNFVFTGAGKDAIPALENPEFLTFSEDENANFYVAEEELVIGVSYDGTHRAYPHAVLDWHEIINDEAFGHNYAVIYCPLTGTATVWDLDLSGGTTTFGVSGLLYNSNVIPYDRGTNSNWTQIEELCVNGQLSGTRPLRRRHIETTWETWKSIFQNAEVLSENTGFDRDYNRYPYGAYRSDASLLGFPLTNDDSRLHRKERVHAVIVDGEAKVYRFASF